MNLTLECVSQHLLKNHRYRLNNISNLQTLLYRHLYAKHICNKIILYYPLYVAISMLWSIKKGELL